MKNTIHREAIMEVGPILSTLKRNKIGAVLLVMQVALTLAIVSNVIFIVGQRMALISRPTGIDEHHFFAIGFRLVSGVESGSMLETDLQNVRAVPGVVDAVAANTYPLRGDGAWGDGVSLVPGNTDHASQRADTGIYAMDQHAIGTLGLKLLEGRNFMPEDVMQGSFNSAPLPHAAIVSRSLARQLFAHDSALGKIIYLSIDSRTPITIVGVVERLQTASAAGTLDPSESENSLIIPLRDVGEGGLFLVRVQPGRLDATMRAVQAALLKANPNRIFGRLRPFDEVRSTAYEKDRSLAIALSVVCLILIVITALGIVGLTSFWVAQRRRQIGIRRALGATRLAIVRYFLIENAMLGLSGVLLGITMAYGLNVWLLNHYGVARLPMPELLLGAIVVVFLGQAAAMLPALRAANIAPAEALRSL